LARSSSGIHGKADNATDENIAGNASRSGTRGDTGQIALVPGDLAPSGPECPARPVAPVLATQVSQAKAGSA